jgi:hypothetical protein
MSMVSTTGLATRMAKVFTFPLESNVNKDKDLSTSCVGGFRKFDALCAAP